MAENRWPEMESREAALSITHGLTVLAEAHPPVRLKLEGAAMFLAAVLADDVRDQDAARILSDYADVRGWSP